MASLDHIRRVRDEILRIAALHGAANLRVFGSAVRGEDLADSDLDLLVTFDDDRSLLDHVALKQDLEDLLGSPVDVVTDGALHEMLRDRVLAQAVPL
jgi:predicted nucleotidyltransferase